MIKNYRIIVQTSKQDYPYEHELSAALILAEYFQTDIIFLRPSLSKTPDLQINEATWELKSPTGNSKNTIHNTFKTARKQSLNIVIDLRRCKMYQTKALAQIRYYYRNRRHYKGRLLVINKNGRVIDIT